MLKGLQFMASHNTFPLPLSLSPMAQSANIDIPRNVERLLDTHGVSFASLIIDAL